MMVPKVDLANHSFAANADWMADFVNGTLTLTATQDIAEGKPVCIDYGPDLDNTQLMRVFGFIVPGNPNDRLDRPPQQAQQHPAPALPRTSQNLNEDNQRQHYLLADSFLQAVGMDSIMKQYDQDSLLHNEQGLVSCYKDCSLSRKLSAVLSLPLHGSDQCAEGANGHGGEEMRYQGR